MFFQQIQIIAIFFATIVGIFLTGAYIFSRIRKQDADLLRQTNTDLNTAIDNKGKEIRDLIVVQELQKVEINNLKGRIEVLEHSNKTLEDIFKLALNEYFTTHPEIALRAKGVT